MRYPFFRGRDLFREGGVDGPWGLGKFGEGEIEGVMGGRGWMGGRKLVDGTSLLY